jgi:hypothetical protein
MPEMAVGDDERKLLLQFVAQYEAPAYIRRARQVELAYEEALEQCSRKRQELLTGVRWHLKALDAAIGDEALRSIFGAATIEAIEQLRREAGSERLRGAGGPWGSPKRLLRELRESVARFNRRWTAYLERFDLSELNRLRDGYNRHYLLEKECAVGSVRLAATTFRRLEPLTHSQLLDLFPRAPMP